MPRKLAAQLLSTAIRDIKKSGYAVDWPTFGFSGSRNARAVSKDGKSEMVIIQTRSEQLGDDRFLVGLLHHYFYKISSVFVWFEGENSLFKLPSDFLDRLHKEARQVGHATYTGARKEQWRVDIRVKEKTLSAQGSNGVRHDIAAFSIPIPTTGSAENRSEI